MIKYLLFVGYIIQNVMSNRPFLGLFIIITIISSLNLQTMCSALIITIWLWNDQMCVSKWCFGHIAALLPDRHLKSNYTVNYYTNILLSDGRNVHLVTFKELTCNCKKLLFLFYNTGLTSTQWNPTIMILKTQKCHTTN